MACGFLVGRGATGAGAPSTRQRPAAFSAALLEMSAGFDLLTIAVEPGDSFSRSGGRCRGGISACNDAINSGSRSSALILGVVPSGRAGRSGLLRVAAE